MSNKDASVKFLQLVVAGKTREAYSSFVSRDMRHHNIAFAGDAESLERAMREDNSLFPQKVLEVKHVIEDGSLVAVHSHIRMKSEEPGYATVHIFRFEDNHIVEMWDIVQVVPENSPNKNSMF
ncbi:MAG: nuclear transport factor 2 family protein [Ignavibacteriae bacterium]|nr:MAG: nuclear transport factor 2 family protein [Ignavibacteriota bacterium]